MEGAKCETILGVAKKPSAIDSTTIQKRNLYVDKQLFDNKLLSVEVEGDGNCFYRTLSYSVYGQQSNHLQLRKFIAQHLLSYHEQIFVMKTNSEFSKKCIGSMQADGTWSEEESIVTAADFLLRDILMHKFGTTAAASPIHYTSSMCVSSSSPLLVAFYEPGHYRSVVTDTEVTVKIDGNKNFTLASVN